MNKEELKKVLKEHEKWLNGEGGERANLREAYLQRANLQRANLRGANLRGANLREAYLQRANLQRANLRGANLRGANLQRAYLQIADLEGADLYGADLRGADLYGADLRGADLRGANLRGADLRGANLRGANLREAYLRGADLSEADLRGADLYGADLNNTCAMLQCPESGAFEAWKKCRRGVIVKLLIPAEAKRSSATTRKCRASEAKVLEVYGAEEGISSHDSSIMYRVGETVKPDSWDENRWDECSHGIHFFITRQEAEDY